MQLEIESPFPSGAFGFGRYELLGRLASGGMGRVFLCRATNESGLRRLFAVKFMHAHLGDHERFLAMLRQEIAIASRLHHANVVSIVDSGSHEGVAYLVMDYVEGCNLAQLLHASGSQRPLRALVSLMLDALTGLHAAHSLCDDDGESLGLVHRDFSPQNLLVGSDGICRVTDFGIAKAQTAVSGTKPGVVRGKPCYMSPEQITSRGVDHRSDIFAAGSVFWYALTGKQLFQGPSDHATLFNVLKREIVGPSTVGYEPPPIFDRFCRRALCRDPARRYQSARDMAEDLRTIAEEYDLLGSSREVSTWLNEVFGRELARRRELLRRPSATDAVPRIDARTMSLPALDVPMQMSLDSSDEVLSWAELERAESRTDRVARRGPTLERPYERSGRRGRALAVFVGGVLVSMLVVLLVRASSNAESRAPAMVIEARDSARSVPEHEDAAPLLVPEAFSTLDVGRQGPMPPVEPQRELDPEERASSFVADESPMADPPRHEVQSRAKTRPKSIERRARSKRERNVTRREPPELPAKPRPGGAASSPNGESAPGSAPKKPPRDPTATDELEPNPYL